MTKLVGVSSVSMFFLLLDRLTYVVYWRYGDDNCSLEAALKLSVLRTFTEMNCIVGLHSSNLFYP